MILLALSDGWCDWARYVCDTGRAAWQTQMKGGCVIERVEVDGGSCHLLVGAGGEVFGGDESGFLNESILLISASFCRINMEYTHASLLD
jgi:hypothetical protein